MYEAVVAQGLSATKPFYRIEPEKSTNFDKEFVDFLLPFYFLPTVWYTGNEAIFVPKGVPAPPKSIINQPELQLYITDFRKKEDDIRL